MKKTGTVLFLALAMLMILFPTLGHLLPQPGSSEDLNENRALAKWPEKAKDIKAFVQGVESWFNDHLAFRDQLIETNLRMDLALGESPTSTVILGTNGWLFFNEFDEDKDLRGEIVLDEADREALVTAQSAMQAYLKDRGASYYVVIAPNKQTIYPEYLPLSSQPGNKPTRMDQVLRILGEDTSVPCVDVRPALLAAKGGPDLYYRYDSHWNESGSYHAFLALAERLKKDYPNLYIPSPEEITTEPGTFQGDLASMIGMGGKYVDHTLWYQFPNSHVYESDELSNEMLNAYVNPDHPEAPKILFLHDSFGPALTTFLVQSCSELYETILDVYPVESLLECEPDIVIFERVERNCLALEEN